MSGKQMHPSSWKEEQSKASQKWRSMTSQQQDVYTAKAAEEQGFRELGLREPHPAAFEKANTSNDGSGTLSSFLSKGGRCHVSKQQVLNSYKRFKDQKDWWRGQGAGLASADGILPLDDIDLHLTDEQVQAHFSNFAALAQDPPHASRPNCDPPHQTACLPGQCVSGSSSSIIALANKFVHSMSSFLADGTLVFFLGWGGGGSNYVTAVCGRRRCFVGWLQAGYQIVSLVCFITCVM